VSWQSPRGFMRGIVFHHFLDTYAEWHALVQGFCEVLCPWPPRHKKMYWELHREIVSEHHYYMSGRALAVVAWIVTGCVIAAVFS